MRIGFKIETGGVMKRIFLLLFLCLFIPFSIGYAKENGDDGRLVGVKFSKDSISFVLTNDDAQLDAEVGRQVLAGLVIRDADMYVGLSPAKSLFSQLPEPLLFSFVGDILLEADIELKRRIKQILSDLKDKEVFDFWQKVAEGSEEYPQGIKASIVSMPAEVLRLKDGFLIKELPLTVEVTGKRPSSIIELIQERLNNLLQNNEKFLSLRRLSYSLFAAQYLKELKRIDSIDFNGSAFIDSQGLIAVKSLDVLRKMRKLQAYISRSKQPIEVMFEGYKMKIYGLIDFTSLLKNVEVKELDLTVDEAISRLGRFERMPERMIVFSQLNKSDVIKDWMRISELAKDWRVWRWMGRRRAQLLSVLSCILPCEEMDIFASQSVRLGLYVSGSFFREAARDLLKLAGLNPDFVSDISDMDVKYIGAFDRGILPQEKERKLKKYLKLGWMPFLCAFDNGRVVAIRLDSKSREFYLALLEGKKTIVNNYIDKRINHDFWNAYKDVKILYNDPLKQAIYLLLLRDEYRAFISSEIAELWPQVYSYVLQEAGIDLFSGPVIVPNDKK